ncbi:twin-arginine translocation signal domain-containing protein [Streptomyces sviceus]|uniref:twin-arginine translocation signal domain-containing protein n=1 Tax=Streptomyces TaxID=1883 RepID=UPI0001803406|nr:twin-arginine translocation signal domain-containing protein [Streptomyces sviceus]
MDLSRRGFLQAAALTAAASGLTVACGGSGSGGTKNGKEPHPVVLGRRAQRQGGRGGEDPLQQPDQS